MELLNKGLWSTTFKEETFFVKRYNFYIPEAAMREAKASVAAEKAGVRTPHFYYTNNNGKVLENIFDYWILSSNDYKQKESSIKIYNEITNITEALRNVSWDSKDQYWTLHLIPDFQDSLSYLKIKVSQYLNIITHLQCNVFIHGDLSTDNISLNKNKLVVYDFQHGSFGPEGWDKAYFFASLVYNPSFKDFLNENEEILAEVISAIRWGRSIRKSSNLEGQRKKICMSWIKRDV